MKIGRGKKKREERENDKEGGIKKTGNIEEKRKKRKDQRKERSSRGINESKREKLKRKKG